MNKEKAPPLRRHLAEALHNSHDDRLVDHHAGHLHLARVAALPGSACPAGALLPPAVEDRQRVVAEGDQSAFAAERVSDDREGGECWGWR